MIKPPMNEAPKIDVPTSDEFTRAMGQITWLMTLSKEHRDKPISFIQAHVTTPLMLKQVRVFTKEKQPLAVLAWAYASEDIKAKIGSGVYQMELQDWRSGPEVTIVECISPLMDGQVFVDQFMDQVKSTQFENSK